MEKDMDPKDMLIIKLQAINTTLVAVLKALDYVVNEPNGHPNGWEAALVVASDNARAVLKLAQT